MVDVNIAHDQVAVLDHHHQHTEPERTAGPSGGAPADPVSLYRVYSSFGYLSSLVETARWLPIQDMTCEVFRQWAKHQIHNRLPHNELNQLMYKEWRLCKDNREAHVRLRRAEQDALQALAGSPAQKRLDALQKQLDGLVKREQNQKEMLETGMLRKNVPLPAELIPEKEAQLLQLQCSISQARQEQEQLKQDPLYVAHLETLERLSGFMDEIGLTEVQSKQQRLNQQSGTMANTRGHAFEEVSLRLFASRCYPSLGEPPAGWSRHMLSNLTLGLAKNEIDGVCVLQSDEEPSWHVVVEAVIECKRNPSDFASSFVGLSKLIAFFKQDTSHFDPAEFRNSHYPKGLFVSKSHSQHGRTFIFEPSSFERFSFDAEHGHYVDHLYFLIGNRSIVRLNSAIEKLLLHRFYSSIEMDKDDIDGTPDSVIESIIEVGRRKSTDKSRTDPAAILRMYLSTPDRYRFIMFVNEEKTFDPALISAIAQAPQEVR